MGIQKLRQALSNNVGKAVMTAAIPLTLAGATAGCRNEFGPAHGPHVTVGFPSKPEHYDSFYFVERGSHRVELYRGGRQDGEPIGTVMYEYRWKDGQLAHFDWAADKLYFEIDARGHVKRFVDNSTKSGAYAPHPSAKVQDLFQENMQELCAKYGPRLD